MAKWTPTELLCNAQGLDNGYIYVHTSKPLMEKLSTVISDEQRYKTCKLRLKNPVSYDGGSVIFGSVRLPLANELHPIDDDVKIKPPSSASKISRVSFDNLFSDPIDANAAVCFAFTEPPKLSHKSVVLPGAKSLKPVLNAEDLRIRRPRLNRGGATIANLGVSNGASHQSGYGSMNIGSYERNLANQTGRGNQMYQTGTRAWGAMEPTPKHSQYGGAQHPPYPSNPFTQGQPQSGRGRQPDNSRPPWKRGRGNGQRSQPNYAAQLPPSHQQGYPQQQFNRQGGSYPSQQQGYQQQPRPGYGQQQGSYGAGYLNRPPPPPPAAQQPYSFQGHNRSAPPERNTGYAQNRPPRQNQPPSRVNANVMNDLRSQLASTLQQNKRGSGQHGGNQR